MDLIRIPAMTDAEYRALFRVVMAGLRSGDSSLPGGSTLLSALEAFRAAERVRVTLPGEA